MRNLHDFIITLKEKDIHVYLEQGKLKINAPEGALDDALMLQLKSLKDELLGYLKAAETKKEIKIPLAPPQLAYPMSSSQKRLWLLSQLPEGSSAYNVAEFYELRGDLNAAAFELTLKTVINRHEILRTVFKEDASGEVKQYVLDPEENYFNLPLLDFRAEIDAAQKIKSIIQHEIETVFDLTTGPLLRFKLIRTAADKYIFTYVMHHIISDGWSMRVLIKEVAALYTAFSKGETNPLAPLVLHYKDFSVWQQGQLVNEQLVKHKAYWLNRFSENVPLLELPYDRLRPAIKTYKGSRIDKVLGKEISNGLKQLIRAQDATLFMGLLAGINTLLYKYSGQSDIVVGTPIAGRAHADLENQIGFYINTLALRAQFEGEDSFISLLNSIKAITLAAYEHQAYPFDELISNLPAKSDKSRNALFDVMVALQNTEMEKAAADTHYLGNLLVQQYDVGEAVVSKFDLTFNFTESGENLIVNIEYNTAIYDALTVTRMAGHMEQLFAAIIANPLTPLEKLSYLSESEERQLLQTFNATALDYPENKTIIDLFEAQVAQTPDHVALVSNEEKLTYKQLNERANQLAVYLKASYALEPNNLAGIQLERSPELVVAILAVLKAGSAYVPIDPSYPQQRIDYMVADSNCKVVLTRNELEKFNSVAGTYSNSNIINGATADDLAYVIYTSGSTGKPKGVLVEHHSLVNLCHWHKTRFGVTGRDAASLYAGVGFDAAVWELFPYLISGAGLHVIPESIRLDSAALNKYFEENNITISFLPTKIAEQFFEEDNYSLRYLLAGGDKLNSFIKRNYQVVNNYGPTEATVVATSTVVNELQANIPIGKPIANTSVYILTPAHQLCPVGVAGEIYISGAGLARGYLNNEALTSEKFISHPFKPGERMYKTGDSGKWLADGSIAFTGRKDEQVKIRGHRIELGEIEAALQEQEAIVASLVIAKTNKAGNKELVAYMVSKETISLTAIRKKLSSTLPAYMVPAYFVQLDEFPLTTNGKVDKHALPDPEGKVMNIEADYLAPRSDIEKQLVSVYEEVLTKQPIGVKEDFFVLGGDSIKSIQIVSRLKQRGYTLTIQDVLLHPVIEELAGYVTVKSRLADQRITEGRIPLSPVQKFFFEHYTIDTHHYNQAVLLHSKVALSVEGLGQVFDKLLLQHDALRMVYQKTAEGWIQENKGKSQGYSLEVFEPLSEAEFINHCERIQSTINLENGPLFKAGLFKGTNGDRLLLVAHHLVIDGVSWRILFEDISGMYQNYLDKLPFTLPLKSDSFGYWQQKQVEYAASEALQQEAAYWSAIAATPVMPLPKDYLQGSNLVADFSSASFLLDMQETEQLLTKCYKAYHTDTNDVLLTALTLALTEVFGMQEAIVSLEGHGRENIGSDTDISRTVGWFTSIYPVVFDARYSNNIIRQLIAVKESLHRVPNKGIGYGILHYLAKNNYTIQPEITFNYLGDFGSDVKTKEGKTIFEFSGDYHGKNTSALHERTASLDVTGMVAEEQLRITLGYSKKQYTAATMERLLLAYKQHLQQLIINLMAITDVQLTPVDLTYKTLLVEQVEELNKNNTLENVYPLTPLQEGIFYHWLAYPGSPAYFEQTSYEVKGDLNIALLKESYDAVVTRHAILRSSFTGDFGEKSVQIVRKNVTATFNYLDYSGKTKSDVAGFKLNDRANGFDLYKGSSQMRLSVLNLGSNSWQFIWSYHHILMDGWCVGILVKEFFQIYYGLMRNSVPVLDKVYPYAVYLDWLNRLDKEKSLAYWKKQLTGYTRLSFLPKNTAAENKGFLVKELQFQLAGKLRHAMKERCAELAITENTFINAAWGILLGRYNKTNDIVFGTVVSGRPAELEGIEKMVGLFINTVPVRVHLDEQATVRELLKTMQQAAIERSKHHYTQLSEIQKLSELKGNLFDNILVFENYPVDKLLEQGIATGNDSGHLSVLSAEIYNQSDYGFTFTIVPGESIHITFSYNGYVYDEALVHRFSNEFLQIMELLVENSAPQADSAVPVADFRDNQEVQLLMVPVMNKAAMKIFEINKHLDALQKEIQKEQAQKIRMKNLTSLKNKN